MSRNILASSILYLWHSKKWLWFRTNHTPCYNWRFPWPRGYSGCIQTWRCQL